MCAELKAAKGQKEHYNPQFTRRVKFAWPQIFQVVFCVNDTEIENGRLMVEAF